MNLNYLSSVLGRHPKKTRYIPKGEAGVMYVRVSSKEQFLNNMSIQDQTTAIVQYSEKMGITIIESFGGTYESAQTDGRKEFTRMINYIKARKGKIKYLYVWSIDRFSRTGGEAIALKDNLLNQFGVQIIPITAPVDPTSDGGALQQDITLIFSHYDNKMRRMRTISSMSGKLDSGIWCTKPPRGYDIVKVNNVRTLVINEDGKKIKMAFQWKAKGMKNEAIIANLKTIGFNIYKQELAKIFGRPFYCGLINHGLLNGKVVLGKHEPLISVDLFMQVNNIKSSANQIGVPHLKEHKEVPLKTFIRCEKCGSPFTGYEVKAKNLWYYKCRKDGCRVNRSAKKIHTSFLNLLNNYSLCPSNVPVLQKAFMQRYNHSEKENFELASSLGIREKEIKQKIDTVEENYFASGNMTSEQYQRIRSKLGGELLNIESQLAEIAKTISNLAEMVNFVITLSSKLATTWSSMGLSQRERFQKLIFPEGIRYDTQIDAFRTPVLNPAFAWIAEQESLLKENEKGDNHLFDDLSPLAEQAGLEPATPSSKNEK